MPAVNELRADIPITSGETKLCGIFAEETNPSENTHSKTAQSAAPATEPMTIARTATKTGLSFRCLVPFISSAPSNI
jgi:uncharacterized YccA/Bax inhibitor family protein